MIKRKSFFTKIKCAIRKWLSAKIIPTMIFNSWRIFFYRRCGYKIGKNVFIGMHCYLDDLEPKMFTVENNVTISYGCYFACHGRFQAHMPITIKEGAYLGMRSNIISGKEGVIIGRYAVVGACSLVLKNVEDNAIVAGIPARRIHDE